MKESPAVLFARVLEPDPAVDAEDRAGDVIGLVGCQKRGRFADVFRRAQAAPGQGGARAGHGLVVNTSCSPGVSIQPGSITFTLIRCGVSSPAIVMAMRFNPPFAEL